MYRFDRYLERNDKKDGACFFWVALVGYMVGLILTHGITQYAGVVQLPLLYIVPSVLVAVGGFAHLNGRFGDWWEYEEDVAQSGSKGTKTIDATDSISKVTQPVSDLLESIFG
mmetsp:Transcript_7018/g.10632  ORF Transcript_7018/g.10632 Transcript_7018/m.10632 type:complete len:113 (+) Transcript_7018:628-966(+)